MSQYKVTELKLADIIAQPTPLVNYTKVDDNIIKSLLQRPFHKRSQEERDKIVREGRPGPFIDLFLKPGKQGKHNPANKRYYLEYSNDLYEQHEWLAANGATNKVHCWSCLLMHKGGKQSRWVEGIYYDPNSLILLVEADAHAKDRTHIDHLVMLTKLMDKEADAMFADFATMNSHLLSKKAVMNRALLVLRKLTDVAISVYALDKSVDFLATDWLEAEKFQALFNTAIAQNKELVKHCREMGNSFKAMIRTFFQIFLDCVQTEIQLFGYLEIIHCDPQPFCSIQIDSMRDIDAGKNPMLSILLRYVNPYGAIRQRFFGFEGNVERSAATVSRHLEIAMVRYRQNTVSQSYDGSCVFVGELNNLKRKIQITAPCALLVPSVDHPLNKVLLQGVFNVRGVQLFVSTLEDLIENPKQLKVLAQLKGSNTSPAAETEWSTINSEFLSFLLQERESFISAYRQPPDNACLSMNMSVILKRLVNNLHDMKFMFLMYAFRGILKITDELSDVLRLQLSNVNKCSDMITCTIKKLRLLNCKDYFDKAMNCIPIEKQTETPSACSAIFDVIIKNLVIQLQSRFADVKQLEFLQLGDSTKFATYNETFPEQALLSLDKVYGKHFDMKLLEKELKTYIYPNPLFHPLSMVGIMKKIREMGFTRALPQSYKLFCLFVTLPVTVVEECTGLKQINSFIAEAKKHTTDRYLNHRSLPVTGLKTLMIPQSQVIIERPLVLELVEHEEFRYKIMKKYIMERMESGVRFDCAPLK